MADKDKSGIEMLRKLAVDANEYANLWVVLKIDRANEWGAAVCGSKLSDILEFIADQIERERAEELAAAKRDLTDEARATVERLRGMDCARPRMDLYEIVFGVPAPTGASSRELNSAIRDRLIELIEHGSEQGADVAALRELADRMDAELSNASDLAYARKAFCRGIEYGIGDAPERIRKAVDGAPKPDPYAMIARETTLSEEEVRECVGRCMAQTVGCFREREALGADGLPIEEGDTVYTPVGTKLTVREIEGGKVHAGFPGSDRACYCAPARFLSHTTPDTQERIAGDKNKAYISYWGCRTAANCCDCPSAVDGKTPDERYGVVSCAVAQGMDIARRQHELDAKTTGGE